MKTKTKYNHLLPKRPLSAYNLFYRYKRIKIIEVLGTEHGDEEAVKIILAKPAGLEDYAYASPECVSPSYAMKVIRRENIRETLKLGLMPRGRKLRSRGKGRGIFGRIDMSRLMAESWKEADPYSHQIFYELFEEGRQLLHMEAQRGYDYDNTHTDLTATTASDLSGLGYVSNSDQCAYSTGLSPSVVTPRSFDSFMSDDHEENQDSSTGSFSSMMHLADLIGSIPTPDFTEEI
ncbi:hypothetical protein ACHAXS_006565 [Conticribra weissflogii]